MKRDDKNFMKIEIVSWDETLLRCFLKYGRVENQAVKPPLMLALYILRDAGFEVNVAITGRQAV